MPVALVCLTPMASAAEGDLCSATEWMIASCQMDENQGRTVSFCANANKTRVTYTFGTRAHIEWRKSFSNRTPVYRWVDKATDTTYLGFRSSGYAYVFGIPQEKPGARAFLEVTHHERRVQTRTCTQNSFGAQTLKSSAIKEVPDDTVRNNGFVFPPH